MGVFIGLRPIQVPQAPSGKHRAKQERERGQGRRGEGEKKRKGNTIRTLMERATTVAPNPSHEKTKQTNTGQFLLQRPTIVASA